MKKIQLLAFFCAVLAVWQLPAQGFRRTYDLPAPHQFSVKTQALTVTPDGGFLFYALSYDNAVTFQLVKTDPQGDTIWTRSYPMPLSDDSKTAKLLVMPNGNYALELFPNTSGYTALLLFDPIGHLLTQRAFLGTSPAIRSGDGFFLLQPNWDSTYNVYRLDGNLADVWQKKVQPAPIKNLLNKSILDMTGALDGGFCLQIHFDSSAQFPQTPRLIKFDANGDIQWERSYAIGLPNYIYSGNIRQAANGDFVMESSSGSKSFIQRIDAGGNPLWSKEIPLPVNDLCLMPDGSIAFCGGSSAWNIGKFSPDGDLLFSKTVAPASGGFATSIACTPDNQLVFCGNVGYPYHQNAGLVKTDASGNLFETFIEGHVIYDRNHDCSKNLFDPALPGWLVTATAGGHTESALTDTSGFYSINMPVGDFILEMHPPASIWKPCDNGQYQFTTTQPDTLSQDLLVQDSALCALLDVSLGASIFRRCQYAYYNVAWANRGTIYANNAAVAVILPPELDFIHSTLPVTSIAGDTLWYDLGTVEVAESGNFTITVQVNCDSTQTGQTLCTRAHIFPDTVCARPANWSGARVVADVRCVGDTVVTFTLENTGDGPTEMLDYIITEDHVVLKSGQFNLNPGQQMEIQRQANGSMQRIEAEQEPGYPFPSMPSAAVEGCGGWNSLGRINQYALNDADPFTDIDCREVIASYDPNDKQGFPTGYSSQHLIEPGTELTYLIRFQNTGNDTAFYIEVRDTLSPWLDPATVRMSASSHPYTWSLHGPNALSFRFDNILLPDSNINEPGSHGFIQFRVRPRPDAPLGAIIDNSASIYFDFNAPVLTNTTTHQLGHNFYVVSLLDVPGEHGLPVSVYPNPFREYTRILLPPDALNHYRFQLYDPAGRLIKNQVFTGPELMLRELRLTEGLYWFDILDENGNRVARGKLAKQ